MPRDENQFVERLLVMALDMLLSVEILLMISLFLVTHSHTKWYGISICFDAKWWTEFFVKEISPWISLHKSGAKLKPISQNIPTTWLMSHDASLTTLDATNVFNFSHWGHVHSPILWDSHISTNIDVFPRLHYFLVLDKDPHDRLHRFRLKWANG